MFDGEAAAQRALQSGLLGRQFAQIHLCLLCGSMALCHGALSPAGLSPWDSVDGDHGTAATPGPGLDSSTP